ncbi:MAG: PAS domain-containing protein [Cyanobacteriota bacterium]
MGHEATKALFAHWNEVRRGPAAPDRNDLDPALIGPLLADPPVAQEGRAPNPDDPDWPAATGEAMRVGVEAALAAAVIDAARGADTRVVVFTGGDGRLLRQRTAACLEEQGIAAAHRPLLCLRSLARLRPEG